MSAYVTLVPELGVAELMQGKSCFLKSCVEIVCCRVELCTTTLVCFCVLMR